MIKGLYWVIGFVSGCFVSNSILVEFFVFRFKVVFDFVVVIWCVNKGLSFMLSLFL